ncbi:MAG: hypothetical protein ACFE9C_16740 [Candidatus Hodarchaeota archaeon]
MKKTKILLASLVIISLSLAFTPTVIPQIGTYQFHGAPGQTKILKVRTVNNTALSDLFGADWDDILEEFFGTGCTTVGARFKSLVVAVNFSAKFDTGAIGLGLGVLDVATYVTNNWNWTTGAFSSTPDRPNVAVMSFYDPTELTAFVQAFYLTYYFINVNVSLQTAGANLAQLPTSVAQYLGAIVWEDKWENFGNSVVHHAELGDFLINYLNLNAYPYFENCTETWTYSETYGAWIGYNIKDDADNIIYEFTFEAPGVAIPGYELIGIIGAFSLGVITLVYVVKKKKR